MYDVIQHKNTHGFLTKFNILLYLLCTIYVKPDNDFRNDTNYGDAPRSDLPVGVFSYQPAKVKPRLWPMRLHCVEWYKREL